LSKLFAGADNFGLYYSPMSDAVRWIEQDARKMRAWNRLKPDHRSHPVRKYYGAALRLIMSLVTVPYQAINH